MMGHLNSFSASGGGNFPKIFQKFKCPGVARGGMLKLRFDWYITDQIPVWNRYVSAVSVPPCKHLECTLSRCLIICAEQTGIYISAFLNTLMSV